MLLNKITAGHPDYLKVKKLYETAFPKNERPLRIEEIMKAMETIPIDILGIYPDDTMEDFAGFFIIIDAGKYHFLKFSRLPRKNAQRALVAGPSKPS